MALQFAPTIISPVASFWKEGDSPLTATAKIQHNNQFTWGSNPELEVKIWDFNDKTAESAYIWNGIVPNDSKEKTTITLSFPESYSYYKSLNAKPDDWINRSNEYYIINNGSYILNTDAEWRDERLYYEKINNAKFQAGITYKLQIAYSGYGKELKTWSQVKIIKYLETPSIALNKQDLSFNINILGERIKRYRFNKQDWTQIDENATSFPFLPPKDFISNDKLVVSVETVTGAIITKKYSKNIESISSIAKIKKDVERGFIYFKVDAETTENKILYLANGDDECQILGDSTQTLFIDLFAEAIEVRGYSRTYAIDENTIKLELFDVGFVDYEYSYLCDKDYVLNLKYDGLVNSFKKTTQEQKQDTIGGLYPYIFRNENAGYAEMPLSALIASDLGEFKIGDPDANNSEYCTATPVGVTNNYTLGQKYKKEKEYREEVYNWLTNGKPKVFKSPTEGVYVVQVMNTSMSAKKELGNLLYKVSGTMYEVDNVSDYAMKVYKGDYD